MCSVCIERTSGKTLRDWSSFAIIVAKEKERKKERKCRFGFQIDYDVYTGNTLYNCYTKS